MIDPSFLEVIANDSLIANNQIVVLVCFITVGEGINLIINKQIFAFIKVAVTQGK